MVMSLFIIAIHGTDAQFPLPAEAVTVYFIYQETITYSFPLVHHVL